MGKILSTYPHKCIICGELVKTGDDYIANIDDELIHYDCGVKDIDVLIYWLGGDVNSLSEV